MTVTGHNSGVAARSSENAGASRREPLAARLAIGSASPGGVTGSNMLNIAEKPAVANKPRPNMKAIDNHLERERMVEWLKERIEKSKAGAVIETVTLTPVLAALLLDRNKENRPISGVTVARIARDVSEGRWEFNGESIVVSKNGLLNDGQHRCKAVVETGRSIPVVMVFGPERDSRMTLDTGLARTVGHFLGMNGYADSNNIAAVAGLIYQYQHKGRLSTVGAQKPTKAEALKVAQANIDSIQNSLNFVSRKGATKIASKSMLAFCHWAIFSATGKKDLADGFMLRLIDGDALGKNDPILICRNKLLDMRRQSGAWGNWTAKAELIFRAWNCHRTKEAAPRIWSTGRLPDLES